MLKVLSLPVQSTSITKACSPSSATSTEPSKSHDLGAWSSAKNDSDPLAGFASAGVRAVSAQLIGAIGADFTSRLRKLRAVHAVRASEQSTACLPGKIAESGSCNRSPWHSLVLPLTQASSTKSEQSRLNQPASQVQEQRDSEQLP
jgi:hypothetical protein